MISNIKTIFARLLLENESSYTFTINEKLTFTPKQVVFKKIDFYTGAQDNEVIMIWSDIVNDYVGYSYNYSTQLTKPIELSTRFLLKERHVDSNFTFRFTSLIGNAKPLTGFMIICIEFIE